MVNGKWLNFELQTSNLELQYHSPINELTNKPLTNLKLQTSNLSTATGSPINQLTNKPVNQLQTPNLKPQTSNPVRLRTKTVRFRTPEPDGIC